MQAFLVDRFNVLIVGKPHSRSSVPYSTSSTPRLRARPVSPPLHVVLVEPEIPPNTGNVARLCAATTSPLHLVGPLGFRIDEHSVRRAGVDYWHLVDVRTHADFDEFLTSFQSESPTGQIHLFSAGVAGNYLDAAYAPGDALVFGKESVGLSEELLGALSRTRAHDSNVGRGSIAESCQCRRDRPFRRPPSDR